MNLKRTGSVWNRDERNNLNENWSEIEESLGSFDGVNIIPKTIGATQLKDNSVGIKHIAPGAVTQEKIAKNAVTNNSVVVNTLQLDRLDRQVHCVKTKNEILVLVPSLKNYVGYSIKRKTVPYQEGVNGSNLDLWSLDRISAYSRDGNEFTEIPILVYVYTPDSFSTPMTTQDTIFRREGEQDYSGGNQHGDEKLNNFELIIGRTRVTTENATLSGVSVELLQETLIYPDSKTHGTTNTPYLKVNKSHHFSADTGYTLKQSIEFLKETTIDFACVGALQMRRQFGDGSANNINNVIALDNAKLFRVTEKDSGGNHLMGMNETHYKITGYYKEIMMKFETDSDYSDFYFRNWADSDVKFYALVAKQGDIIPKGKVIKSKLNYQFNSVGG